MNIKIIQPDYYKIFHCIGSECRSNCCNVNWNIHVDKKTYKKYTKISKENILYEDLSKYVSILNKENKFSYAQYEKVLREDGKHIGCAFQNKDGLCKIHAYLGEEYLSDTCKLYPRILNLCEFTNKEYSFFERSCSISCEEVLNIFIKKQDYIEYEVLEEEYGKNYIIDNFRNKCTNYINEDKQKLVNYYPDIKSIIIAILQNRDYSFENRLVLFAIFCDKLHNMEKNSNQSECINVIDEFLIAIENKEYDSILNSNFENDMSYAFSWIILNAFLSTKKEDSDILKKIYQNISNKNIMTIEDYKKSDFNKSYKKIIIDKEIFLEHIFVNEVFIKMIPFYKDYNIFENAEILIVTYSLYRLILSGYLGGNDSISDEELVDITAYFGKLLLHTQSTNDLIIDTMKEIRLDSLANLIVLIKG